jgi:hypothetical protein
MASKMDVMNYFDIERFWLLLKMELFRCRRVVLLTLVISFGLLFFEGLLLSCFIEKIKVFDDHDANYVLHLLIVGFILSSLAFNDLSDTLKRYRYLTLPVSTFEKFVCMWLLTSVGWIILFTISYTLYTLFANAIGAVLFKDTIFLPYNPFSNSSLNTMKVYFVLQGIFLVGAVYFKGYVFPKTLIVLILFFAMMGVLGTVIMGAEFMNHDCGVGECPVLIEIVSHKVSIVLQWIFWWVLAPVCWINTYWGLKDQEI